MLLAKCVPAVTNYAQIASMARTTSGVLPLATHACRSTASHACNHPSHRHANLQTRRVRRISIALVERHPRTVRAAADGLFPADVKVYRLVFVHAFVAAVPRKPLATSWPWVLGPPALPQSLIRRP
jgi:hypothetical protein